MIKYSSQPPFCVSYPPRISNDVVVPIHVYHAYDAVMIYAQALTEALREGYDPRNGTNVMERIRNRRYRSVLGFDVSQTLSFDIQDFPMLKSVLFFFPRKVFIDSNGDAEGNYTVLSMLPFHENESTSHEATHYVMQPVGYFQHNISTYSPNNSLVSFRFFLK